MKTGSRFNEISIIPDPDFSNTGQIDFLSKAGTAAVSLSGPGTITPTVIAITAAANSSGVLHCTVATTAAMGSGESWYVTGISGSGFAPDVYLITVINGTTFSLNGVTASGSYTVSSASATQNVIWRLPASDGTAGSALVTDGTGNLSWGSGGGSGLSPLSFGARADVLILNDGSMTSGSPDLSSSSYTFVTADIGKLCFVYGAGASDGTANIPLASTISSISGSAAVLANNAMASVSNTMVVFGTDDTAACQNFISAVVAIYGYGIADFLDLTYMVTQLNIPSNIVMMNANFLMRPGNTRLLTPITIDGRVTPLSNIILYNILVNGLRQMQWGMATGPSSEDGGNHGFVMRGRVSNVALNLCAGLYCASDGIAMISYSTLITPPITTDYPDDLAFQRIIVNNSQFNWNRRHGYSGDSLGDVVFDTSELKYNSLTINGVTDNALGGRAAPDGNGNPYGTGFWFEDNTALASGGSARCQLINCQIINNWQRSVYIFSHASPFGGNGTDINSGSNSSTPNPGFLPRQFSIYDCVLDGGLNPYFPANSAYKPGIVTAVTNANPAVFTTSSAPATAQIVGFFGFTGLWAVFNWTYYIATGISGTTFSIPFDTTGLGSMTGNPQMWAISATSGDFFDLGIQIQANDPCIAPFGGAIPNRWGSVFEVTFEGNLMPRGRFAVNQCGRATISDNDINSLEIAVLSTGDTYRAGISVQTYNPEGLLIGFNNLHGGQPFLTGTTTEGINTYPNISQWNYFYKQISISPYQLALTPNDVGIGAIIVHGADPSHPNQIKEWDGVDYWSAMGGYGAGIAQFYPYPQSVAYVINAAWATGVATFELDSAFSPATGEYVAVKGITPTGWNCSGQATHIDTTHFSMLVASNPGSYTPAAVPGNNGILYQIIPGNQAEGLMIYDPVAQTPLQLTAVGWKDVNRTIVMDFCTDVDYTWDTKVLVDILCSSPATADHSVILPPMSAIFPLPLGYSRVLRVINTAASLGVPYTITVHINPADTTGYIGYLGTSTVLTSGDAITISPDGRGWQVSSIYRASGAINTLNFIPQSLTPSFVQGTVWFDVTQAKLLFSDDGLNVYAVNSLETIPPGAVGADGGAQFGPLASDPTGVSTGYVYYSTATNSYRFWDGTHWQNVALAVAGGLTVPGGGTGQVTFPSQAILLGNGTSSLNNVDPATWPSPIGAYDYPALLWNGSSWGYGHVYVDTYVDAGFAAIQVGGSHPAGGPITPSTVPTTAATQVTPYGFTTSAQFDDVNNAINSLLTQIEKIRAALVSADIMS